MAIVPSGKRKIMVAQTFGPDQTQFGQEQGGFGQQYGMPQQQRQNEPKAEDIQFPKGTLTGGFGKEEESIPDKLKLKDQKSEKAADLTEYIFSKLENFGYPPRRLEQFSDEFVNEKIYPGGIREVAITIPDRYYAKRNRLSDEDFSGIVKEIQSKFGLTFIDAERKDKRITMNFSSQKPQAEEGEGEAFGEDVLDDVYTGGGTSKGIREKPKKTIQKGVQQRGQPAQRSAMTTEEMIKISRSLLAEALLKKEK